MDNECSAEQKSPSWSLVINGEPLGQLRGVVRISPMAEVKGMHNEIVTKVQIPQEGTITRFKLLLLQTVPSSFYVDQYELQRLALGNINPVFRKDIDVELPAYMSRDEAILYYFNLSIANTYETKFGVPWHSRYHECSYDGVSHVNATIPPPILYTSCMSGEDCEMELVTAPPAGMCHVYPEMIRAPCSPEKDSSCVWMPVTHGIGHVTIRIPVGHCTHGWFVAAATLLSTFFGTVALGFCSAKY